MKIPLPKLKALILYLSTNTNTKYLGKVKLMKLLYFVDFIHLKKYGAPITYDTYFNLEYGPIPSNVKNLVDDAAEDIDNSILADIISFEHPNNTKMCRIIPNRNFSQTDRKYFSETELEVLESVCKKFGNKTTKEIVDASHKDAPWRNTKLLDTIPYSLAADDIDSNVTKEEIDLLMKIS